MNSTTFRSLEPVSSDPRPLDEVGRPLADHYGRCVRVARRHPGHYAGVGHPDPLDASDAKLMVHHRQWIVRGAHLARPRLVVLRGRVVLYGALPVGVATEFEVLAVLYRRPVQLESVPGRTNLK